MRIKVRMTRAGNIARHGAGIAELDLEEYLCGVVPAEIGEGSHGEALRAQAVAARTFAVRRVLAGIAVDDTTRFQAYRAELRDCSPRSREAVADTAGMVLVYGGRSLTAIILPPTAAPADGAARFGAGTIPIMCIRPICGTWPPAWKDRRRPAMVWECRRWAVCGRRSKGFLIMRYWRFIMAAQSLYGSTAGAALFLLEKIWKEWAACIYMS